MSALSTLSRARSTTSSPVITGVFTASHAILIQKRTRSFLPSKKPDKKQQNLKNVITQGGLAQNQNRAKRQTSFSPMSAGHLQHPVFESESRTQLQLPNFHPEFLSGSSSGKAMQFSAGERSVIRAYGLPRNLVFEFRLLSKPCSVVRDVTLSTIGKLDGAAHSPSSDTRAVITGLTGSGKSYLLLQVVEYCVQKDWVVLYIPRAIKLVDSSTQYVYDPRTRTYVQPVFSYELLKRFQQVNQAVFNKLKTSSEHEIANRRVLSAGSSLTDLVHMGLRQQNDAPAVLSALLSELGAQTQRPVLLAVDDFQALFCQSKYRDPRFMGIKPYHLSLPRLLLEYASGKKSFHRGAVLGALSTTNVTFQAPLELRESLGLQSNVPTSPYVQRQQELLDFAKGLQNIPIPAQLSVTEAASLYELWQKDKALNDSTPSDQTFMRLYSESSGNPRDFVWKGMLASFAT